MAPELRESGRLHDGRHDERYWNDSIDKLFNSWHSTLSFRELVTTNKPIPSPE